MKKFIKFFALTTIMATCSVSFAASTKLTPKSVVVIWDISASATSKDNPRVFQEVVPNISDSIRELKPVKGSRVILNVFGDDSQASTSAIYKVQTRNTTSGAKTVGGKPSSLARLVPKQLKRFVTKKDAQGSTNILTAIDSASEYCQQGECILYIVSDGIESSRYANFYTKITDLPDIHIDLSKVDVVWYGMGDRTDANILLLKRTWKKFLKTANVRSVSIKRW